MTTDDLRRVFAQRLTEVNSTTHDKQGKFIRPEMATLDAVRVFFWGYLPVPKESRRSSTRRGC